MENVYISLGVVAVLFSSIYFYAFITTRNEQKKKELQNKLVFEQEQSWRKENIKKRQYIDEKVKQFKKRSEEIQYELKQLNKNKEEHKQIA